MFKPEKGPSEEEPKKEEGQKEAKEKTPQEKLREDIIGKKEQISVQKENMSELLEKMLKDIEPSEFKNLENYRMVSNIAISYTRFLFHEREDYLRDIMDKFQPKIDAGTISEEEINEGREAISNLKKILIRDQTLNWDIQKSGIMEGGMRKYEEGKELREKVLRWLKKIESVLFTNTGNPEKGPSPER